MNIMFFVFFHLLRAFSVKEGFIFIYIHNRSQLYLYCVSLFSVDDGPYGKTKDISGPEQTMASRRHSIPGIQFTIYLSIFITVCNA